MPWYDELLVEIEGKHGEIDPRAVADAINAVDKILRNLDIKTPARLTVSQLRVGSAKFGVRTDPDRITAMQTGLAELRSSSLIPRGWSAESVAGLVDLRHVNSRRGVQGVQVRAREVIALIDETIAAHAQESIAPSPPSLGAVRGTLYRYNNNKSRRSAGIEDHLTGRIVEVSFPVDLVSAVRAALDHEVEVWGEVRRDGNDRVVSIAITGIETVEESLASVTLDDVAGILSPGWTGDLDSVEWVRRQRD